MTRAVAGLGFCQRASIEAMREVLEQALMAAESAHGTVSLQGVATAEDKVAQAAIVRLAEDMALPLMAVPLTLLPAQAAQPRPRVPARYGAHSLAEAAALAAAGPGAVLAGPRQVDGKGQATAAIALIPTQGGSK
ncbi:MAG: cobalamin biosynthesis protein [Burkholderiaceae bacterium]